MHIELPFGVFGVLFSRFNMIFTIIHTIITKMCIYRAFRVERMRSFIVYNVTADIRVGFGGKNPQISEAEKNFSELTESC